MSISWCKVCLCLFLAGCSIHPLYEQNKEVSSDKIKISMIHGREGQKLYGFLEDLLRDINFADKQYWLNVNLTSESIPYALANDGNAQRLKIIFVAQVLLKNNQGEVVLDTLVKSSATRNISSSQGDALLSMYDANDNAVLKELAFKIVEYIKVALDNES